MSRIVSVTRVAHFNAAHRLHNPDWSAEKNAEVFGLCNNPSFHGHNYELHLTVRGAVDEGTGYVMDMKEIKDILEAEVLSKFDHRNLNLDVPAFKNVNPTAENIAVVIWDIMRPFVPADFELSVKLYETPRNYVEFNG
ncbi:MAG: 6-carboxytetrahydropterin synthase [Bacteroidia bacterium]|jgi:6-pyruvoyltetrahydropterin/6-carboxytetrahydropterin synthase